MKNDPIALPADPADAEDFDVSIEALDRGQRARLIRKTPVDAVRAAIVAEHHHGRS